MLTKLINAQTPSDFDILQSDFTDDMNDAVYRLMAEIMGLNPGYCGGRGGSMHMRDAASGIAGTSAIVGGNIPHAAGYALADKLLGRKGISVAFFGDGASLQGATYEAMNIAALYRLPVIFYVENNLYAVSTHIQDATRETRIASRGPMLGFPALSATEWMLWLFIRQCVMPVRSLKKKAARSLLKRNAIATFIKAGARPGAISDIVQAKKRKSGSAVIQSRRQSGV